MKILSDNSIFLVLGVIRWIDYNFGYSCGIIIGIFLKISKNVLFYLLVRKYKLDIILVLIRYDVDFSDCELVLMNRKWLDLEEFKGILVDII